MSEEIFVEEGNLVIFSLWGQIYGSETRTEYAYVQTQEEEVPLIAGYCGFFEEQMLPAIRGMSTPDLRYYNIRADLWRELGEGWDSDGWRDYALDAAGTVGTGGSALPANNALVMRRRTAEAGRANRGRVYLPGVPSSWGPDGKLRGAAFMDAVNTFKTALSDVLKDAATPPVELAFPVLVKKLATGIPASFQSITHWDVNQVVRSQRRREFGVGI